MKQFLPFILLLALSSSAQQFALDPTFGNNGSVATDHLLRPSAGDFYNGDYYLFGNDNRFIRYHYNGQVDYNFGSTGNLTLNLPNKVVYLSGFKVHDNKIYAFGKVRATSSQELVDAVLARMNLDGQLDTSFGSGGVATVDLGAQENFKDILFRPDGSVFAIGTKDLYGTGAGDVMVCKFLDNGTPDLSFNASGNKLFSFDTRATGISLTAHGSGIILGNSRSDSPYARITLQKINIDGTNADDFGVNGLVSFLVDQYGSNSNRSVRSLKILGDKVYCSFYWGISFGSQGYKLQSYSLASPNAKLADIYIRADSHYQVLADGKILVTKGITSPVPSGYSTSFEISRYNADGTLDNTFNGTGQFIYDFSTSISVEGATFVYQHDDGRIFVAGANPLCCNSNAVAMIRIGDEALAIDEPSKNNGFQLFPNPAKDELFVKAADNCAINAVSIIDFTGKIVLSNSGNVERLDVSALQAGVYLVEITADGKTDRLKFVKM